MFWTPPSIPWLTLCLWFIWLGTASWNFLVTSSECQRKNLLEDMLCTFLPLAKGDLVDHVLHSSSYLNYVQRLLGDNEGAMQKQQIAAFADDRHARRNLVVACSAADGWWWWWIPVAVLNSLVSDVKKGSLRVKSVMILVVLSTHAELASTIARGCLYFETGELFVSANTSLFYERVYVLYMCRMRCTGEL